MDDITGLGLFLGRLFVFMCSSVWLGVRLSDWCGTKSNDSALMQFETWLDLFHLNPNAWILSDYSPCRLTPLLTRSIPIRFSFVGFLRYRRWYKKWTKSQKQRRFNENLAEVLQLAQEDIRKLQQQADIEMQAAERQVREVHERIKEDRKW